MDNSISDFSDVFSTYSVPVICRNSLKRSSTRTLRRQSSPKSSHSLIDSYSYWFWCRNLEEQPLRLQLRGVKHPINGILSGHLIPFDVDNPEEALDEKKGDERSDLKVFGSILSKSRYKNMFEKVKSLLCKQKKIKDDNTELNERFLLLRAK